MPTFLIRERDDGPDQLVAEINPILAGVEAMNYPFPLAIIERSEPDPEWAEYDPS
jgi:hypothetical protein